MDRYKIERIEINIYLILFINLRLFAPVCFCYLIVSAWVYLSICRPIYLYLFVCLSI